jgi:NifB/MoaA-like Fe-S oxidoreductase
MVSLFLKEATEWLQCLPCRLEAPKKISLVTGLSFGRYLQQIVSQARVEGLSLRVFPIQNNFLGPSVSVAGLLAGKDIIETLRSEDLGDLLIIPSVALNEEGTVFLDNTTPQEVSEALEIPVRMVDSKTRGLWEIMEMDHGHSGKCTTGVHPWASD